MSDKIPTVESSIWEIDSYIEKLISRHVREVPYEGTEVDRSAIKGEFIEFLMDYRKAYAQFHVQAALKAAYSDSKLKVAFEGEKPTFQDTYEDGTISITISVDSILNAYSLENIK